VVYLASHANTIDFSATKIYITLVFIRRPNSRYYLFSFSLTDGYKGRRQDTNSLSRSGHGQQLQVLHPIFSPQTDTDLLPSNYF
jgi:hypothetical protein